MTRSDSLRAARPTGAGAAPAAAVAPSGAAPDAASGADAVARPAPRPRGRPRKTLAERDEGNRRARLVTVAARLFRRQGFDGTSTRDIAAAVGMRSGSPFYHFGSKGELLHAVMEQGMRAAIDSQRAALQKQEHQSADPCGLLAALIRNHFDVLLGPGNDFIPVMLYEWRSLTPAQRRAMARLKDEYEADWRPVLAALHAQGRLRASPALARLLIFGALNWAAQWYDRKGAASLDDLAQEAMALFIHEAARGADGGDFGAGTAKAARTAGGDEGPKPRRVGARMRRGASA